MSRYIDADKLIEVLEKYKFGAISNDSERDCVKETVLNFIREQPTAYDVEKVVKKLEEESCTVADLVCGGFEKDVRLNIAIAVVKNGGN